MPGPSSLSTFINEFKGGNRAHRYRVSGEIGPTDPSRGLNKFFVRAVSLPPSQINEIRIPYRGRILKWPGDRVYQPWTIRILDENGNDNNLWKAFHKWSDEINNHIENDQKLDNLDDFAVDWVIEQVDENEDVTKRIDLIGCWPNLVGPIDMDANAVDTLVEFNVVVNYQYYDLVD
tara:strand:- start:36737 stop:37264 length:528 start_codon:yes stop_codon:yes gene_type:complete